MQPEEARAAGAPGKTATTIRQRRNKYHIPRPRAGQARARPFFPQPPSPFPKLSSGRPRFTMAVFLFFALAGYLSSLAVLLTSSRAQNVLIFLHWLRPPFFLSRLAPLSDLASWRLAGCARLVVAESGIRGWHILPPGPPYPPSESSPASAGVSAAARDQFFDSAMLKTGSRIVIFFHGNSGTRAFPYKRVDMLRLLGAHLGAHVVTFDYSGFGDSPGRPSEAQFYRDARAAFDWVAARIDPTAADIIVYGQSLGSFAGTHLASSLFSRPPNAAEDTLGKEEVAVLRGAAPSEELATAVRALVLDAPPASVLDAALTHPSCRLFQLFPRMRDLAAWALRNCALDNVQRVGEIDAPLPILVLHGDRDSFIPIEQGRRVYDAARARGNPSVRLLEFPGVGHVNVNGAENFLPALTGFLAEHWRFGGHISSAT